jgi:hypothetical protein
MGCQVWLSMIALSLLKFFVGGGGGLEGVLRAIQKMAYRPYTDPGFIL